MAENKKAGKPKREIAVALGSSRKAKDVPQVLATGKGEVARSIVERAREKGLAVERDADLAQVLAELDLGEDIPEEVFMAVAEILYFIYEANQEMKLNNPTYDREE